MDKNHQGKYLKYALFLATIIFIAVFAFLSHSHQGPESHATSTEKNIVELKPEAQKMAGIQVSVLHPKILTELISAPGEVVSNANLTTKITSRTAAQIIKLYTQEGEHVKTGQALVGLSSVEMAKTQGDLLLAAQEWTRAKNLGKDAVSAKHYSEAQIAYQHAYSTALAYGMTENELSELLSIQKPSQANGNFKIFSPRNGVILNLNFTEGELVEPGRILLQVVEENTVWIEAKLPPDLAYSVKTGDVVRVSAGDKKFIGHIMEIYHQLDETTRTRSVRVEVPNPNDSLHPGQFVNCQIESAHTLPLLALPVEALMRTADGNWAIYVENQPGRFQQVAVKMLDVIDNQAVIEGISSGARVVTKGAFFIHAELNKSSFDTE